MSVAECLLQTNVLLQVLIEDCHEPRSLFLTSLCSKKTSSILKGNGMCMLYQCFDPTFRGLSLCSDCKWEPITQRDHPWLLSCSLIFSQQQSLWLKAFSSIFSVTVCLYTNVDQGGMNTSLSVRAHQTAFILFFSFICLVYLQCTCCFYLTWQGWGGVAD